MNSHSIWKQIKFVTGNANKVREAREILGMEVEQVTLDDLYEIQTCDPVEIVRGKVLQAHKILQCPVLVEDSALVFAAWKSLPGALVKWFEDNVGCAGMLKMLESFENRRALALCCVALHDGKEIRVATGEVHGTIADRVRGSHGFGWDVIFIPEGGYRTYAEMNPEEKNAVSHRRRAFESLKTMLNLPL
ncbi:MAG: RdgB/HAM1 family non-canonical purine NTP pyrophosphatase [Nitrospinaceae bacterium]